MKKFQAGKLNKRINIIRIGASTPDGYGGFTVGGDTTVYQCWAHIKIKNSDIKNDFGDSQNKIFIDVMVRKDALGGIRPTDLIEFNSRQYKINKMYDNELDEFTKFEACRVD